MSSQYDQLLSLINAANPTTHPFTLDNISFSPPEVNNNGNGNTKIIVSSIAGSGYVGEVTLFYERINFLDLNSTVWLFSDTQFTSDSAISLLNSDRNCIFLSDTDIVALNIPNMRIGDIVTMSLQAKPTSINWVGETNLSLFMGFPTIANALNDLVNVEFPTLGYLS